MAPSIGGVMGFIAILAFGIAMFVLNRLFRRREREGHYDPQSPSSAARPGLRWFFDYSDRGWPRDGNRQR